jgi:hypothetical protein
MNSWKAWERRIMELRQRAEVQQARPIPLIDATTLLSEEEWRAFWEGDAETRERIRREYARREAAVTAGITVPTETQPITAIVVGISLPSDTDLWRYRIEDELDCYTLADDP